MQTTLIVIFANHYTLGIKLLSRILRAAFVRRAPKLEPDGETALLNYALDLAQEWGEYWMKPIQERLQNAYPNMSPAEADRLNAIAQAAMEFGHGLVYSMAKMDGKNISKSVWRAAYAAKYPWVDDRNLRHLLSTGKYYAMKDGFG